MGIILGFLPFLTFAVVSILSGAVIGLIAGAAVSGGLIVRDLVRGRTPKLLEGGTFVLLAGLALYTAVARRNPSLIAVRLCVDAGLLAIVVFSMAIRHPFTLRYAREQVAEQYWKSELFIRTNYAISAGWAVAFLVMVAAEGAMLVIPGLPRSLGTLAIAAALLGGFWFTKKRTEESRAAAARQRSAS